ncbi:fungal zn(2)-Cys(6) binuclear cluster domain-containing protein [Rhizoctonia solani AG-1 IA]|uniref:Fungal zn(2)-Cys(6) binuclear cluster domain-containing protein n=1 Tax=Thanatephorus cucumeris (strain AG1-IA) TaxID=983506 RepID=L8WSA6_THACA|nr:fungal zn(2)-Cys(6) binuclear cluster domain-containing protein [Rhizoctonia solani AG-1 IA]
MSRSHFKPGPHPRSCFTCRQRRKKCDLSRPHCERCKKGGFKCLGYADCGARTSIQEECSSLAGLCTVDFGLQPAGVIAQHAHQDADDNHANHSFGSLVPKAQAGIGYNASSTLESNAYSSLQDSVQTITHWDSPLQQYLEPRRLLEVVSDEQNRKDYTNNSIRALCTSIPASVDAAEMMREGRFVYIINDYQMQRVKYWFTIPPAPVRDLMMDRLGRSKAMIWAMCLSANLFRELGKNPNGLGLLNCIGLIDSLEDKFSSYFYCSSTLQDAADCLLAQLELAFLRFASIGVISGYTVLQKVLPKFLYLVAANPDLYMEHPNGSLVVSFPHTISSSHYELKRFLMYDTATALILGVSPLVEYGYDGECNPVSHGLEWVHGVPVALAEVIAQVNSWRAGSRAPPLHNWEILERRVLDWEPQSIKSETDSSGAEMVARLALHEGWRHGICGVSSHDFRVQASIQQIVRLGNTVVDLPIGVHMFIHCVVVGLGARYEKQRSMVRDKLISFKGTRVWFFRGSEFSLVLDHLWHGAGAGGAPVTWDDYVRSRCTVLPI